MKRTVQIPGALHVFSSRTTRKEYLVFLPSKYGESDSLVRWVKDDKCPAGGYWESRELKREEELKRIKGQGPKGLLGRMKNLLNQARSDAKKHSFCPPSISAEGLVLEWKVQNGLCAACGLPLELLKAHHDHNHETGESRGFLHAPCNFMEGFLRKLPKENRQKYIRWTRKVGL